MNKHYLIFTFLASLYMTLSGAMLGLSVWSIEHKKLPILIIDGHILLNILGVLIIYAFVCSLIPWGSFSKDSVKTFNTLSIPKKALWSNVSNAKLRNILGLSWLCLYTEESRFAIWVPLNIRRSEELRAYIKSSGNQVLINAISESKT